MNVLKDVLPCHIYEAISKSTLDSLKLILSKNSEELCELTCLGQKDIDLVRLECAKYLLKDKITVASNIAPWKKISTGCKKIDDLLKGGVPINGINEVFGSSGTGKTQFCLQLSLMTLLPKYLGGLECGVLYICTEDAFPSKRLRQLSELFTKRFPSINKEIDFEKNIFIEHMADYESLRRLLYCHLDKLMISNSIGLVVIDSIAGIFRGENEDVCYINRKQEFVTISKKLMEIGQNYNTCILCVNQVTDNIDIGKTEPCLGLAWSNMVTCRFKISKNISGSGRKFSIVFSPELCPQNCDFIITKDGICNVD